MVELDNTQLIIVAEIKPIIEKLKEEGKEYPQIREAVLDKFKDGHWLVADKRKREESIAAALFVYAMTDELRAKTKEVKEITGHLFV